jgi:hypothetical protein
MISKGFADEIGDIVAKLVFVTGAVLFLVGFVGGFFIGKASAADLTPDSARAAFVVAYGQVGGPREWLDNPPPVFLVNQRQICERYGAPPDCPVYGMYQDGKVYVREDLDFDQPHPMSVLVHEFVHHFQALKKGAPYACDDWLAREQQAYAIQAHILEKLGEYGTAASVRRQIGMLFCK